MPAADALNLVNPHAAAAIAGASESCTIVASEDIVDERGVKLLARHQRVSSTLQQRLLERKLKQPLEACLRAEDGVTTHQLYESLLAFLESDDPWAPLARCHADALRQEVRHLPLHSVAQLLLTTAQATRPDRFEHAVRAMAMAGALFAHEIGERYGLRLALLGGLLHDVGEMYVQAPVGSEADDALDLAGYRAVAVHPRVGEMVLSGLTDYPPALCRAIGEHHERLDGSGYPARRMREGLSVHGRLLAVVEAALGVMSSRAAPCQRADLALRLVPGEFDPAWSSRVTQAAAATDDAAGFVDAARDGLLGRLDEVDRCMLRGRSQAVALVDRAGSPRVAEVAARALHLLDRLRDGWNAIGLWSPPGEDAPMQELLEAAVAQQELSYRLSRLSRDCLWAEEDLRGEEAARLDPLWASLAPAAQHAGAQG